MSVTRSLFFAGIVMTLFAGEIAAYLERHQQPKALADVSVPKNQRPHFRLYR